ncbi:MAG: hypothetical protein ACREIU_00795 [Planctomycetota bacterium]
MVRLAFLASAAALCAGLQAPSGPTSRGTRDRAWFVRLTREDLDSTLGKGVGSEGETPLGARLSKEVADTLADSGGRFLWVAAQQIEKRTRVVLLGAPEGGRQEECGKRLEETGFRVQWLLVTGIEVEERAAFPRFSQIGGVFHGMSDRDEGRHLVPHLPEVRPERLLALTERQGGKVFSDPIRLEVVSGDPGVGGTKLQRALRSLPGVRLVPPGGNAERFTVEVEIRALSELRLRGALRPGHSAKIPDLGASPFPVVEQLRKERIEVREAQ